MLADMFCLNSRTEGWEPNEEFGDRIKAKFKPTIPSSLTTAGTRR